MFDRSADFALRSERSGRLRPGDPRLFAHLPYAFEVNDRVIRTRDNALMVSFEVDGIDGLTNSVQTITALRDQAARLLAGLDERFTFYIHRLSRPFTPWLRPLHGAGFAADLDRAWQGHLGAGHLIDPVIVVTVVRTTEPAIRVPFLRKAGARVFREDSEARLQSLTEAAEILKSAIGRPVRDLSISDGSLIGFYAALSSGVLAREARGQMTLLAEDASSVALEFEQGVIRILEGPGSPRFAAVLFVSRFSMTTLPGLLDGIDGAANVIVTHSFTPVDRTTITERALGRLAQMRAAAEIAGTIEQQLVEAIDGVKTGRLGFGTHQLTITVFAETRDDLDAELSRLRGLALQSDIRLTQDRHATDATFFAMHPGNMDYRCRAVTNSTVNFADLAALHMADRGLGNASLPWGTPLTVFETAQGSAHRFSLHEPGGAEEEPSIGHTLVLGPSGSGKTSTIAFLAAQALRTGARVILFDKDRGLEMAVRALGGRYAAIRAGQGTGLGPLETETGARGQAFLLDWLAALLERDGTMLTPRQSDALKQAIRQNDSAPTRLRTFGEFASLIGDVGDDRALARKIGEWAPDGRFGWVFGAAEEPVVDFQSDVTALDLTELLDLATERTAILSYLFRRIEMLMEDKRPTLLVIDEAWRVLDDGYFVARLKGWLVTARKHNVVVVMMTQFPRQILESRARAIFEGLPNQMIFPNVAAESEDYAPFHLSENELEFVLSGHLDRRMALWRTARSSTILDVDLKPLGSLLTVLGGGQAGERAFGLDWRSRPDFWKSHEKK